jgi:parallel beta-helix repeat protein
MRTQLKFSILVVALLLAASLSLIPPKLQASSGCTYEVYMSAGVTYGENCATGAIVQANANPATTINAIIALASGGSVYIEPGTYIFTTLPQTYNAIGSASVSSVELYGADNATVLEAGTNLNGGIIGLANVNGWYIHDLEINGNAASQSLGGASSPYQTGIGTDVSSNDVIAHCYILNEKTYGIYFQGGSDDTILNNTVVDSWANGIILYGTSNSLVEGNTVNGVSDVGISISGTGSSSSSIENVLTTGNTVSNTNLHESPFGADSDVGIMVGDNGADQNITVSNNQVLYGGICIDPGSGTNLDIYVLSNTIYPTNGSNIYAEQTNGLTIQYNVITTGAGEQAMAIGGGVSNLVDTPNTINQVTQTSSTTAASTSTSASSSVHTSVSPTVSTATASPSTVTRTVTTVSTASGQTVTTIIVTTVTASSQTTVTVIIIYGSCTVTG